MNNMINLRYSNTCDLILVNKDNILYCERSVDVNETDIHLVGGGIITIDLAIYELEEELNNESA